jgi:hypothetical protein
MTMTRYATALVPPALKWWSMRNCIEPDLLAIAPDGLPRYNVGRGCMNHPARQRIDTMSRIFALAACGVFVSACSGMPSFNLSAFQPAPATEQVQIESEPPGADARTASGATCRTPCTLGLPMSEGAITVALNGYTSQTVPVQLERPTSVRPDEFGTPSVHLKPNPIYVELEPTPPPAKKPAPKKPKVVARAKPAAEQSAATAATAPALSPAPAGATMAPPPWPTPR